MIKRAMTGLSVLFSSRQVTGDYIKHVQQTSGLGKRIEVIGENNPDGTPLAVVYNRLSKRARYPLQVFIHDDLIFETQNWGMKLLAHFREGTTDIIGLAGVRNVLPASGCWWENRSNMVGIVNHVHNGVRVPTVFSPDQGNKIEPVITLDGLFIAVNKGMVSLDWDESLPGFHFYDLGFTFPCYLDGNTLGVVTDIRVTHLSVGQTNGEWELNRRSFVNKYKDELPCVQTYD